jgi:HAMP domain-containing protein
MRRSSHPLIRRNKLVNPRLQGGVAIQIAAIVLVAGSLVALLLFRDIRQALLDASYSGHFGFSTPFRIVNGILVRRLLVLFAFVFAGGLLAFLWYVRRVRRGISRLVEAFQASGKGDLSSPADTRGPGGIIDVGKAIDNVRSYTLARIGEVRGEVEAMRTSALSEEEFIRRWEALKGKIERVVP